MVRIKSAFIRGATILFVISPCLRAAAAEVTCYVDSVNGDDSKSGLSRTEAVKTQTKVGETCTVVRYKRGSIFNEKVRLTETIKTYTNYGDPTAPLPKFQVPSESPSGPVFNDNRFGGLTVDGIAFAGARSDLNFENRMVGAGIRLGANSKLLNSEITDCEIGVYLDGEGSLVQNNNVHDLVRTGLASAVDPSLNDGGQGVVLSTSNHEISDNTFIRCMGIEPSVGSDCTGGAIQVVGPSGATVSGINVHNNYINDSCGMIESGNSSWNISTKLADSDIHHNISIDSGWMAYLQTVNTEFENFRFYNNTLVHHAGSTSAGILAVIYSTAPSAGSYPLQPKTVFMINNLFVFDGVTVKRELLDPNFGQTTNLVINTSKQNPGFVNLKGDTALDFDLTDSSPAINAGTTMPKNTLDYAYRVVPDPSGKTDVGAFEFIPGAGVQIDGGGISGIDSAGLGGTTSASSGGMGGMTGNSSSGMGGMTSQSSGGLGGMTSASSGEMGGSYPLDSGAAGGMTGALDPTVIPTETGGFGGTQTIAGSGGAVGKSTVAPPGHTSGIGGSPGKSPTIKKGGCNCQIGQTVQGPELLVFLSGLALVFGCRRRRIGTSSKRAKKKIGNFHVHSTDKSA
jgi:hypothetical protein